MKVQVQKPLFAWDCLEDFPALATIRDLLEAIPDGMLLQGLKTARGRGRNDYPVRSLWGVVVLTVALRHTGFEACLGELRRNPALAKLIGIESKEDIPKAWNVSRFLDVPGEEPHRPELQAVFNRMVQRLGEVVSDLGKHTAGDATSLNARRLRCDVRKEREAAEARAKEQAEAGGSAPVAQASSDGTRSAEKPVAFARLVRKDRTKAARGKHDPKAARSIRRRPAVERRSRRERRERRDRMRNRRRRCRARRRPLRAWRRSNTTGTACLKPAAAARNTRMTQAG